MQIIDIQIDNFLFILNLKIYFQIITTFFKNYFNLKIKFSMMDKQLLTKFCTRTKSS